MSPTASNERKKKRKRRKSASGSVAESSPTGTFSDHLESTTRLSYNSSIILSPSSSQIPPVLSSRSFLTSNDNGFANYVKDHYPGFVHLPVVQYEQTLQQRDFHAYARQALERLRDASYYQYDIVMAGGKHSSRTFVKRTLVGEPGITYKYLGVRLFAHAWSGPLASPAMKAIGEVNRRMIEITKRMPNPGLYNYNLTLINFMEPTSHTSIGFKEEANYGMGKVSVSWHADSSLESGSSIGVYHCFPTQRAARWDWRIALRPSPDSNKPSNIAPVVVNTKDGDLYFLLGDFNENYQHCVLAGSQANRISSTHRVAVTAEDTYDYILKRVKIARKRFRLQLEGNEDEKTFKSPSPTTLDAKIIRYCQRVLTELEMEWIAQYWLQGAEHDKMHVWWQRPMKTLEAYFSALEEYTYKLCQLCVNIDTSDMAPVDVLKVLLAEFKSRQSLRRHWDERRGDKIYQRRISAEYRPVARPLFLSKEQQDGTKLDERLPKDLSSTIHQLSQVLKKRSGNVHTNEQNGSLSTGCLTTGTKTNTSTGSKERIKKKKKKQRVH
ncbi:FTO catalytic domain containing protein [Nitzschia inconspicua]|uniref:Alpha-ketoglutarate-dependent dioxygenase FTO n=1 Tax=Nitzschia inconspicua TaxID=303405 RepID=A0A9K3PH57_9STRA|nr:FTO catalytic domain containing protein [Nitzschia inconspicua]